MDFISDYMYQFFEEVTPYEFYRDVFPIGELEERGKQEQGKYNGVIAKGKGQQRPEDQEVCCDR